MTFFEVDIGQALTFKVRKGGKPEDLTGATVALLVKDNPNSPFAVPITDAANGIASYIVQSGDFPATEVPIGEYVAQLRVTFSASDVRHGQPFGITSKPLFESFADAV